MALRFYNSMGRKKEDFRPIVPGEVRLYTCGPTVYNYAHIGNFRTFLFEDMLRRVLAYCGYRVIQVMNFTDVDDKTIRDSQAAGEPLEEFTERYKQAFLEDVDTLRMQRAEHYPAATDHIHEMVEMVKALRDKGHTYEHEGSIYFRLSSYGDYGRLTNIEPAEMRPGDRVDSDEYGKDDARDFALWKAWCEEDGDVFWETDLGRGRPGWHLECSAMSVKYLGEHFDIHTGGVDNRFPHHENEIAQSCCATGEDFANYWLHSEFLLVENSKMSKSKGNFYTVRELVDEGWEPAVIRFCIQRVHYRAQMNLSREALEQSVVSVRRLREFSRRLEGGLKGEGRGAEVAGLIDKARSEFRACIEDDMNTSGALGHLFILVREANGLADAGKLDAKDGENLLAFMKECDTLFEVLREDRDESAEGKVAALVAERTQAKAEKNWARADEIREEIAALGYTVKDTPDGPVFSKS